MSNLDDVRGWGKSKWSEFTRTFVNYEKLFPRVQRPPSMVSDDVQNVHNIMRNFVMIGGRIRTIQITSALAVGTNDLTLGEPAAGFIQFPIVLLVTNPDAASRDVVIYVAPTGNPADPWGNWTIVSGSQVATARNSALGAAAYKLFPLPPICRGNTGQVTMLAMTGGNNALINYLCAEVPGEAIDLADFLSYYGKFSTQLF